MTPFDWRSLPPLPALRAFEAAARLGSFSAAARVLNVTPPAVAQQVRALERQLGLRLVAEASRRLRLTGAGARLADALNGGFAAIAAALEAVQQAEARQGLRVTLTHGFAHQIMVPILPAFWAAHPDIPLSLSPESRMVDLSQSEFDLAIRSGDGRWTDGVVTPLYRTPIVLVGTPSLAAQAAADPQTVPWILSLQDAVEDGWLAAQGLDRTRLKVIEIENPVLACAAAVHGLGLVFATEAIVHDDIAAGRLRMVPGWDLPVTAYWTVTPHGPERAALRLFVDWLRRRLRTV